MPIESPTTYGDFYWKQSVDATKAYDESLEKLYAPLLAGIVDTIPFIDELSPSLKRLIDLLTNPPSAGFGAVGAGVALAQGKDALDDVLGPARSALKRRINTKARETWLNINESNTLYHRKKIDKLFWNELLAAEGYEDVLQDFVSQAAQPFPSIPDLILYSRYTGQPDNVWGTLQEIYNIDPTDFKIWNWLGYQRLTIDQTLSLFRRGVYSGYDAEQELLRIGWQNVDIPFVMDLAYQLPNAMLMIQGDLVQNIDESSILTDIIKCEIHPDYAKKYLDAILTKPASTDLIAYQLRIDPTLQQLPDELRKIGIHPDYFDVYKTLANPIPPVADLITMAVREAFSPSIAARFGQYQDFPPDFEKFAAQKGLTPEWAKRYWAAHWSLPSPQQGFEMLHRGIINPEELSMLLRALDVMPFWRDKLVEMAFKRIGRIDIRRMYRLGILDQKEVLDAYKELGYDEQNAKRMADFVVQQTKQTLSKFSSTDVINAYKNRFISSSQARGLLSDIGIKSDEISYIIETAEHKRDWDFKAEQIKAIRNLYKKNHYSESETRGKLNSINLPTNEIDVLMQQWETEKIIEPDSLWTAAQTLGFLKKGLITSIRATREFKDLGYNQERINVYIQSTVPVQ